MKSRPTVLFFVIALSSLTALLHSCGTVSYLNINVPEEGSVQFLKLTDETNELIAHPAVYVSANIQWDGSPMLSLSPDGRHIAYLSVKNKQRNIMIRPTDRAGSAIQRTFRAGVNNVDWSPDGKNIVFSETGATNGMYVMEAMKGSIMRQVTTSNTYDASPAFSTDCSKIFFSRSDVVTGTSIWSYDIKTSQFSNYSAGMQPSPLDNDSLLCVRTNLNGVPEIWKVNYTDGSESVILGATSDGRGFSSPQMSPDGEWIICVGNSTRVENTGQRTSFRTHNLDIFAVRKDGTDLVQLTYHSANDMSPQWSPDGKSIYFLSQRGTAKGEWNIWKMNFLLAD